VGCVNGFGMGAKGKKEIKKETQSADRDTGKPTRTADERVKKGAIPSRALSVGVVY